MAVDQQLISSLKPILQNLVGDKASASLLAALEKENNEDFQKELSSLVKTPSLEQKVKLVNDVWKSAGGDLSLIIEILRLAPASFQQIALEHYDAPSTIVSSVKQDRLLAYQSRLFSVEPTAVLLGLLRRGTIAVSTEEDDKVSEVVQAVLEEGLHRNYRIDTTPIKGLLAGSKSLATADPVLREKAETVLKTLQRLQALVRYPQDIHQLIEASFDSAQSVATCSLPDFLDVMKEVGMDSLAARRIYDQAIVIELRNEQAWALGLQQRNEWAQPRIVDLKPEPSALSPGRTQDKVINLSTLFQDMDTVACEDCSSVLSPAAYFVDLLRLLQTSYSTRERKETLFDLLEKRRPDLENIELSCTNTNVTIPYLDLVNEVLEAQVESLNGNGSAKERSHNMTPDDTNSHKKPRPRNINLAVYQEVLSKKVYPMTVFPYNYSIDAIRSLLSTSSTTRFQVLKTFQSPDCLLNLYPHLKKSSVGKELSEKYRKQAAGVISRAIASEALGLQHDDFMAISGAAYYDLNFWETCQTSPVVDPEAEYRRIMGIRKTAELWGYENTPEMLEETSGDGLTFVKRQLLRRAGISTKYLDSLLKTQFLGHRLVMASAKGKTQFSKKLDDMRLRLSLLADADSGTLTEDVCRDMQAFIRLQRKIGWSIAELDSILSTLRRNPEDESSTRAITPDWSITPEILQELSAVKQISELTPLDPLYLQPLWGDIDTNGPESLYDQLFLRPELLALDSVFKRDKVTKLVLKETTFIGKHKQVIIAAFSILEQTTMSAKNFALLLTLAGLSETSDLSLTNISKLYRVCATCTLFDIKPIEYQRFHELVSANLFEQPTVTLENLIKMRKLRDGNWSIGDINRALGGDMNESETKAALKAASRLHSGTLAIETSYPTAPDNSILASPDAVTKAITLLFQPAQSAVIHNLIEGIYKTTRDVDLKDEVAFKIPEQLSHKLSCITLLDAPNVGKTRVTLSGIITEAEKEIAKAVSPNLAWCSTVEELWESSRQASSLLAERLFSSPTLPTDSEKLFAVQSEANVNERRVWFLKHTAPILKTQLRQQLVVETVASDFPINNSLLLLILSDIVKDDSNKNAFDVMNSITPTNMGSGSFDGLFFPPVTSKYQFLINAPIKPEVSIQGIPVEFTQVGTRYESSFVSLINGQPYAFSCSNFPFNKGQYVISDALLPSSFAAELFLTQTAHDIVQKLYKRLGAVCKTLEIFGFEIREVAFLNGSLGTNKETRGYLSDMSLAKLLRLADFKAIKTGIDSTNSQAPGGLLSFLEWIQQPNVNNAELYARLSSATGWSSSQIETVLTAKYPQTNVDDMMKYLTNEKELLELTNISQLLQETSLEPGLLFRMATPENVGLYVRGRETDFTHLKSLELSYQGKTDSKLPSGNLKKAYDSLRDRRRHAMVNYLLQHPTISGMGILDANHLFEYLLIDVQMGPQLETSRIKQAISTVQLFIQRSMRGLEKTGPNDKPLKSLGVSALRWSYMSKYTLWEANRKLFLYPENWIDPVIRDNKTELFKAFESSIMQNNIDMEKISGAISSYVYGLHEIASLDVRSYFHEQIDQEHSKFHFFGRTRQAPFQYYYRVLEAKHGNKTWIPWSKIDVDIPSLETDNDGQSLKVPGCYLVPTVVNGRLFLFLPQFMLQTAVPAKNFSATPGATVSAPGKYWEIKMGWTEYRNGRWSPKRVSQSILKVPGAGDNKSPPSSTNFQFYVDTMSSESLKYDIGESKDVVVIDVNCWGMQSEHSWEFPQELTIDGTNKDPFSAGRFIAGRFKIRESQVTVAEVPLKLDPNAIGTQSKVKDEKALDNEELAHANNSDTTIPTTFSKVWSQCDDNGDSPKPFAKIRRRKDLRVVQLAPPGIGASTVKRDFTWTISYQDMRLGNPSGLIVDVASHVTRATYFMLPVVKDNKTEYKSSQFDSSFATALMERAVSGDVVTKLYNYLSSSTNPNDHKDAFGGLETGYHEHVAPYALYTWELGMHAVSLLMERLLATQQFDLALSVAHLVFDPTVEGDEVKRCWKFLPFTDAATRGSESVVEQIDTLDAEGDKKREYTPFENSIMQWKDKPFTPHAIARDRPMVYMKRFVLKYIEILIASGDQYFRQNSLESIQLAIQRYVEASHLFGPAPQEMPKLGKMAVFTFNGLKKYIDVFSNAQVDLELDFPYSSDPFCRGSKETDDSGSVTQKPFTGLIRSGYFCVPANPEIMKLRNLIDDRFYKIRNSLDINGNPVVLPLFDAPLDPGLLAQAQAAGLPPSAILNDLDAPMPNYRFTYLLQKAFEVCSELKALGDQFLTVKEKRDAEGLTLLLAQQELLTSTNILPIKELQKSEVEKSIESLEEMRKSHVSRLQYYLSLIGESPSKVPEATTDWTDIVQNIEKPTMDDLRMSSYEKLEMDKAESSASLTDKASILELMSSGLAALPNITTTAQPMGVGAGFKFDAENMAKALQGAAKVMQLKAQMDSHDSQRASRKGQMTRQLQDRRLQANLAGRDVKHVDKDILVQKIRMAVCEKEIESQRLQIEKAAQIQEWHRSKYTNEGLYVWLENSFRRSFYETYLLAMQIARRAEKAFQFETATRNGPVPSYLSQTGYWDTARDGLLSATNLYLGLKRLEMAAMERRPYDYELTKNVSVRQIDPLALISLRQTGSMTFSLDEILFDMDFPGHYFRRIKSVSASVYCLVGRYTGVNCALSLVESRTRVSPSHSSYRYQGRDDTNWRVDRVPISSVAMSSGQSDAGVFELNMNGERYVPFEGAGAVSTWKIEFPSEIRQFDLRTISDVVLHVRYTANDGGSALRNAANKSVKEYLKEVQAATDSDASSGAYALLEVRNDFANEWRQMLVTGSGKIALGNLKNRLPFWAQGQDVYICRVALIVQKSPTKNWIAGVKLKATRGDQDIELEEGDVDFGENLTVLLNKNPLNESVDGDWELGLDAAVFDEAFFRASDIYVVVKYTTSFKEISKK
ncbi:hypothetical protein F4678DRAFT_482800 [Xylaria arbuscula]|nr:hypothetical protein F4678DRAFT_482800 [Xylaria arbuscula]